MPVFNEQDVRARARQARSDDQVLRKSYSTRDSRDILLDSVTSFTEAKTYDMFLSHSIRDAEIVLGVKKLIEDLGYSTYVDWIDDPTLDRTKVTPKTADVLRRRMRSSKSLMYITTDNADSSRWMPWECGYFDGLRDKVAIVPVKGYRTDNFEGLEYLGLYPYCVKAKDILQRERLWIHRDQQTYVSYEAWLLATGSEVQWQKSS